VKSTPVKMDFLLFGHGRSGTHYMTALFRSIGLPVGKLWYGKHGMAHHFPFYRIPHGFDRVRDHFRYVIHYVRDPWLVVESTYLHKDPPNELSIVQENATKIPEILSGDRLERVIRSVVFWNEAIKNQTKPDLTVKVEDAVDACIEFAESRGFVLKVSEPPPHDVNHRTANEWDMDGVVPWDEVSPGVMEMLLRHCRDYGYQEELP